MSQNLSSAAVVIGALRVKSVFKVHINYKSKYDVGSITLASMKNEFLMQTKTDPQLGLTNIT